MLTFCSVCVWSRTSCHWQWLCLHLLLLRMPVMKCIFFIPSQTRRLSLQVYKTNTWQMKRRHASQWVSGPCYFLVIHQRLEWLQCDSCVITWEAPNKWVDDMFEQLQTVTLSLCHFNVYHSPIAHESEFICALASIFTDRWCLARLCAMRGSSVGKWWSGGAWVNPITVVLINLKLDALKNLSSWHFIDIIHWQATTLKGQTCMVTLVTLINSL